MRRAAGLAVVLLLAACSGRPEGVVPYAAAPEMRAMLEAQASPAVGTLPVDVARLAPTVGDGVRAVQLVRDLPVRPAPAVVTQDVMVAGAEGPIGARVYTPPGVAMPAPVVVYFHGGGWDTGSIDTDDAVARGLAVGVGAVVVSVTYRLAPEARFPAAHDDADAAFGWVVAHAGDVGGDARRVAVAGSDAGGSLALAVALDARDRRRAEPVHVLLVEPVAGTDLSGAAELAGARPLGTAGVAWWLDQYARSPADLRDRRLDLVARPDLAGLPPVTLVLSQIDPLRSGGAVLGQRLAAAGVGVEARVFPGVTHGFMEAAALVPEAREAMGFAAGRLRAAFAAVPAPVPEVRRVMRRGRRR